MMEVTTEGIRRAKLQPNSHYQQTNIQLLQARCPTCQSTNNVKINTTSICLQWQHIR